MKKIFISLLVILLAINAFSQNTLNNMGLTVSSPAQVAYGLRQLSSNYNGPAIKVRRMSDNAEANIDFDTSTDKVLSASSIATLTPGVTVNTSLGNSGTGTISTVAAKTGTITIVVNKTGTISGTKSSATITGTGTSFMEELVAGDLLYQSSNNTFLGVVKNIISNTSLTLTNNCILEITNPTVFRTANAAVTGSATSFLAEFAVGDRIFKTDHTYLGTISSIASAESMTLNARDAAVVATGITFEGTSTTVTGSGTSFTGSDVGKMLISNNVTLGIIASVESTTSVTLTAKAGVSVSGLAYKLTESTMTFGTFYSAATVTVAIWYDQSGYGRDAVQSDANTQPLIVSTGVLYTVNGKPAISFPSNDYLQTLAAASWLNNTLYTQNVVSAEGSPLSAYQIPISTTGGNGPNNTVMHYGYRSPSQYTVAQYGNDQNFEVFATTALELHTAVKNTIRSSQMYHNGALLGTVTSSAGSDMKDLGLLNVGLYIPTGSYYKGSISEITVFAQAITEVEALNTNQLEYFGILTATWTGNTDTDWTKPGNWSPEIVPTSTSPSLVVIPNVTNKPIISGTSAASSISVQSGATLTVNSGGTLQLYGTLSGKGNNCFINGTLEFMSTGQSLLSETFYADAVYNLKLSRSGGSNVSMQRNLKVENELNIGSASKLFIQNVVLTLNGTITGDGAAGGLRGSTNASLIVSGTSAPTLSFEQSGTYNFLRNLTISTSGIVSLAAGCNLTINTNGNLSFSNNGKLTIGDNTLTIRGGVINTTTGGLSGGASSNLTMEGITNRTLSFDQTTPGTTNLLNNFSVNTTAANTITADNDFSVNGTLTIAAGQTLNMGTNALGGTMTAVTHSGTILTQNISATPIPTGKTWGGTVNYNSVSTAQTAMSGTYNNLIISTTGGATASGDISVNGVLSLAANPNVTNGALEMTNDYGDYSNILTPVNELTSRHTAACDILDSYILTMGATATHTGTGDVTGRVRRTSLAENTEYSFGSPFTTIAFSSGGTMPGSVMFVITKGSVRGIHANLGTTVERLYQIIQTGGSDNTFTLKLRYLDSELNNNTESELVLWDHHIPYTSTDTPHQHGKTAQNSTENWVSLSGHAISYLATSETIGGFSKYWMINTSTSTDGNTWKGAGADDYGYQWDYASNWSAGNVPTDADKVIIPLLANNKYPTLAATSTAASITIKEGASLNGGSGTTLTVSGGPASNGGVGSWNNAGTFNPGTSTVIFDYTDATISGETNFNNVTINSSKALTPQDGAIVRIGGTMTNSGIWNTYLFHNTVEYNGAAQTVVKPASATPAYRNFILSGSGLKTLPAEALSVLGDFSMSGTASAAPSTALTIGGDFTLGSGTTFTAGSLSHSVGGNFENNGATFTAAGSTFIFNGTSAQTIGGTTTPIAFNNVTVSNASGVTLLNNTATAALNIASGALTVTAGKSLDATETTTLNSAQCLVLKSNATETASFKDNGTITATNGGTARIERYITPYDAVSDLKFHFLSSPVGNAQFIENAFVDLSSSDITDFYKWNESGNEWTNYRGESYTVRNEDFGDDFKFVPGKGYLVAYPSAVTKNFVGAPYTGSLTVNCTHGSGGWNLIGNPYPSSVDWDLVSRGDGMDAALYYYDNATPGYKYYIPITGEGFGTATQYIAPMQGFMVHASAASASVSFANGARTHEGQNVFYKNEPLTTNILDLKVEGNDKTDYARVCFYEHATESFDSDFDAYKLFNYSGGNPELYTLATGETPLAINTEPLSKLKGSVPMGFLPGTAGSFTITAENIGSFSSETVINLEDQATNTLQDLTNNPVYTFSAGPGDNANRFMLHFFAPIGIDEPESAALFISGTGQEIRVMTTDASTHTFTLINLQGQEVYSRQLSGTDIYAFNLNLPAGIYIARVMNTKISKAQKLMIR